ncbi:hypothetical protein MKW98_028301 [Papaver atlanticum]|uniref:UDP-glucuronosyl/UDP-glucosyltransferase n=1 Tax=Papaver atlanticum TaxID=357466 RepID=A0AAD4SYE0_9MAGN|nr:hypothetical protein MKW98_028301 [Papaver atlanticum]
MVSCIAEIASVLLWIQSAMVFDIYYYHYNGYKDVICKNNNDPSYPIHLPNLPLLTFDVNKINMIGIGPLIPSDFLDGQDLSDKSLGGDLISVVTTDEYKDWLDSKDEASVIYVSFGSILVLEHQQIDLVGGVPLIGFPQRTDQGTNAKLIEDVWKVGVRMRVNEETKIVDKQEVSRCVKLVMGHEEIKRNAKKWKELAKNAVKEGGYSD